jgi:hypothetical protein
MPQGSPVPTGFIAPRQCRSPHKPHDALCDNCARILALPTGAGASAFADAAVPRDDADHSVSAASTLVTLSTGAPMDLDLPPMNLDMPPTIASADTTICVVDDDQLTPRGKRKRREERANQTKHYSGGSRAKIARTLSEVLHDGANDEQKACADNIISFMVEYAGIRRYLKSTDKLEEKEVRALRKSCNWLGANFPVMFPHRVISPKLHMLFIHVPEFAEKHHNLGLFSESAFESLHGEFNTLDRTFAPIADNKEAMRLSLERAECKRSPQIKQHVRERRKCSACKGYIAKNSPDKERCKCKTR